MENTRKVALITGATKGIGKEIAYMLAEQGYDISINYRTLKPELELYKAELEKKSINCILVKGDVSNYNDCKNIVEETIDKFGKIDVLINNAGITKDTLLMRMTPQDFTDVIDTNLVGTFNMCQNTIRHMIKQKSGRIINISSVVGIVGNAGQSNYAASKAGIIGFTKSLAKEVASRNILVNAIAPGFIQTDMTDILPEKLKEQILNQIPLNKLGTTKDIANLVKFLTSPDSSYITGEVIKIDGGMAI